jgi:dihydroflavonol-4-reductase
MMRKNYSFETGFSKMSFYDFILKLIGRNISKSFIVLYKFVIVFLFLIFSATIHAQSLESNASASNVFVSVETDPAFWIGTLPNGVGFDANIDIRLKKLPRLRFGILGYSGKWSGDFGKTVLLTKDFFENNWLTQWNGLGFEAQYQYRLGMKRGGLQPGIRLQWNQFIYNQENVVKGKANHFVITPQIGFQWFPFKKSGLYFLPWAGVQLPTIGTDKIFTNNIERETRKIMPIITAHIGWEFKL